MLLFITIAQQPVQKLIEEYQKTRDIESKLELCKEIIAHQPVYEENYHTAFLSGCLWETRNFLLTIYEKEPNKQEEIRSQFANEDSPEFEKYSKHCQDGGREYRDEFKIGDKVITSLLVTFKCKEALDEYKKMDD